ncbi:MAG: 30S ribosomal protein S16 [Dehalococcoidia bacterium]
MLRIRLSRVGKKKQPSYRLVVTDKRNPRDGAHVEIVGHVDPLTNPATVTLKEDRIVHWLQVGAQPSETAAKLLTRAGVMEKAGKAPVIYKGKEVPRAEKGKKGAEVEANAPAPVAAAAPAVEAAAPEEPVAEAAAPEEPAAEPEATADEATAEAAPAEPPEEAETPTEDTETTD